MGTLRRFVDGLTKKFGMKTQSQGLPKPAKYEIKAPAPVPNAEERVRLAYKSYAGRMRKRGLRAKSFRKWLAEGVTPRHTSFGTFRSVRRLPGRTDFSHSADIHIAREKGEMPSRGKWRHMMRIAERAKSKTTQGINP